MIVHGTVLMLVAVSYVEDSVERMIVVSDTKTVIVNDTHKVLKINPQTRIG